MLSNREKKKIKKMAEEKIYILMGCRYLALLPVIYSLERKPGLRKRRPTV
jgi:hypothetical protein